MAARGLVNWYSLTTSAFKDICLFSLGATTDKLQAAQVAVFARPFNLLDLLLTCTNRPASPLSSQFQGPAGPIFRAWFCHRKNQGLTRYLFSVTENAGCDDLWNPQELVLSLEQTLRKDPNDAAIVELLQTRTDSFYQTLKALTRDNAHHISRDIAQILASLCIVTAIFVECLPQPHGFRMQELQRSSKKLWEEVCDFLSTREDDFIQACLEVLSPVISTAPSLGDRNQILSRALYRLAPELIKILEQRRRPSYLDAEAMDLDDPLSHNAVMVPDPLLVNNREAGFIFADNETLQRCMTIQLSVFHKSFPISGAEVTAAELINYLKTLDEADILSAHGFLKKMFSACSEMTRTEVLNVLEFFGEICLEKHELERCESSQCLCIYMMTSFVDLWAIGDADDLYSSASDLYVWFINILKWKWVSSRVLIALAELLERVLDSNPTHSLSQVGESSRTTFFKILEDGDMLVKFNIAKLVPNIFSRFLLKDHDAIFNDVLDSLPNNPHWGEGIALRIYVLAQLAARWHTLLRKSIYHIFETPSHVPRSAQYARKCLLDVSNALGLSDARDIFRLFSSQILYTWSEASNSIGSMPFTIFGYPNLINMLTDVQDEIVGQIMMRANDKDMAELSSRLGAPFPDLLANSLYKAEAYCVARDISIPPSRDSQSKKVETGIKTLLGTANFLNLVERSFPQIVATLFKTLDQEEQIARAFAKRPEFQNALNTLRTITEKSSSSSTLPTNHRPSFRARCLLDELDFLCERTGYDFAKMWTPTLVSFVCRALLESIHPALGSLHACSVLRKIRILVCIAGPIVLRNYPLEMILHALRPFITDFHCSEDSLGIFWYLLEAGKQYLLESPGFLAGIAVSTFVSLRGFLKSSPESTTQESEFRVALLKVQSFHDWFGDFLEKYKPRSDDKGLESSFRRMIRSSQRICSVGNAERGTHESELLSELLQDRASGRNLLKAPVSDLVLSLLCSGFRMPLNFRDDILGDDESAVNNTAAVWQTIQSGSPGIEYRVWAARAMGRAYAATGRISDMLLREQDPSLLMGQPRVERVKPLFASKVAILDILCDMLFSCNRLEVGLVERTLQLIMSKLERRSDLAECCNFIPPSIMDALIWRPYHCPGVSLLPEVDSPISVLCWEPTAPASEWARTIALSLAAAAEDDPVIGPLKKILHAIPGVAVRLLPYVLHDVLLSEIEGDQRSRRAVSELFGQALCDIREATFPHVQLVINTVLYLRNQQKPHEKTIAERDDWLDINYELAASAAFQCRMNKTSLLFVEIQSSRVASVGRRSSVSRYNPPSDLLHDIFKNIGDPDIFYGIQHDASLASVTEKLDYECAGFKNLLFQSAQYDSDIRTVGKAQTHGIIKALNSTNLQGVASAMFSDLNNSEGRISSLDYLLSSAMNLQQWDIPVPPSHESATGVLFRAFKNLNTLEDKVQIVGCLDKCFMGILDDLLVNRSVTSLRDSMRALSILSEVDEVMCSTSPEQVEEEWERIVSRKSWLHGERYVEGAPSPCKDCTAKAKGN